MTRVIGVRFRTAGKIYFFDPLQFDIKKGDSVIVETARGIEYGTVVSDIREIEDEKVVQPLKPVIRIATERDKEQEAANKIKEKDAYKICLEKIQKHGLEMKLIDAEYTFDNNKVLFYFTADGRIDFRELVKDLASVFKTRIELRQIGVRDETKIMGGIGICGRPLCCHSYLSDFIPVSIKMAKEQNLSLNPTKISGVCGRLMCCLKNEEETYEELNRRLPDIGDVVTTEDDLQGEVQSVNVLRQLVKVVVEIGDEKEIREYEVDKLHFKKKHGKKEKMDLSKEELMELERLEEEEKQESRQESAEERPAYRNEEGGEQHPRRRNDNHQNRQNELGEHRQNRQNESGERRQNRQNESGERRQNRQNESGARRQNRQNESGERRQNRQVESGERRQNRQNESGERRQSRQNESEERRQNQRNNDGEQRQSRRHDSRRSYHQEGFHNKQDRNRQNHRRDNRPRKDYGENGHSGRNTEHHDS